MKISTKVEYGVVALIDIALHIQSSEVVTVTSIAERQDISKNYLEQVLTPLRQAGIISGTKGSQGGYTLTHKPEQLKLSTVLNALDNTLLDIAPDSNIKCDENIKQALEGSLWHKMNGALRAIADNVTLADLVDEYKHHSSAGAMFYI